MEELSVAGMPLKVAVTTVHEKVRQTTRPKGLTWASYPACLVVSIVPLAARRSVDHPTVSPSTANSDLTLFMSDAASKGQCFFGFERALQHSFQGLCNDLLSASLAAVSHVSGSMFPAVEELKVSGARVGACGEGSLRAGGTAGRRIHTLEWGSVKGTRLNGSLDAF